MEASEIWTNIGLLLGGIVLAIAAYRGKSVPPPSPKQQSEAVLAGVGLELGNRDQIERLVHEMKRMADALESIADHRQADMKDAMDELLDRLKDAERRA